MRSIIYQYNAAARGPAILGVCWQFLYCNSYCTVHSAVEKSYWWFWTNFEESPLMFEYFFLRISNIYRYPIYDANCHMFISMSSHNINRLVQCSSPLTSYINTVVHSIPSCAINAIHCYTYYRRTTLQIEKNERKNSNPRGCWMQSTLALPVQFPPLLSTCSLLLLLLLLCSRCGDESSRHIYFRVNDADDRSRHLAIQCRATLAGRIRLLLPGDALACLLGTSAT